MLKLQIQLIMYLIKNHIKTKAKQRWYYSILPPNVARGFTLAEVLITLLVIGIVASIVIPALIQDAQDAELHTAWKKTYAVFEQATKRLAMDNGGTIKSLCSNTDCLKNLYLPYLNYSKNCTISENDAGECWHLANEWKYLYGLPYPQGSSSSIILTDGNLVDFHYSFKDCNSQIGTSEYYRCGVIAVDVNGFKQPNTIGRDVFTIYVLENRILPEGINNDYSWAKCCITDPNNTYYHTNCNNGGGCSAKYLLQ